MTKINTKEIIEDLIETFLKAGEVSINLRKDGLTKRIKSDNTPVSNGDLEVNKIISQKLKKLTPSIPIISEETSDNKATKDLKNFWKSYERIDELTGTFYSKVALDKEAPAIVNARRSIVASQSIAAGEKFTEENLTTKRPGNGICSSKWDLVVGKVAIRKIEVDTQIALDDFSL